VFDKVEANRLGSAYSSNRDAHLSNMSMIEKKLVDSRTAHRVQIDQAKLGDEEVDKVQGVLVDFGTVLGWCGGASCKSGKGGNEFAED